MKYNQIKFFFDYSNLSYFPDSTTGLNLKNSWKMIMIGKEVIFSCKDRNSKMAWVDHLQRPLIYSPATSEERRLIRETICRTSSMDLLL